MRPARYFSIIQLSNSRVLNLENTKKTQRLGKIESCIGALNGLIMR